MVAQTRIGSFAEAWGNILIGFWINYFANLLILPMFGFHGLTAGKNFVIGLIYSQLRAAPVVQWSEVGNK